MAPLIIYKCSKCKMVRASYKEAQKCEASHLTAISVEAAEYILGPYPFKVVLTFPDGTKREYQVVD